MSTNATDPLIPLVDLAALAQRVAPTAQARLQDVLQSGNYIRGPYVAQFEQAMALAEGCRHAIGVANGTDAISLILQAMGIGHGDEVIIPAVSFFATAGAVMRIGATPVVVDVLPDTPLMDPVAAVAACTQRTRAIVPVHLFGMMATPPQAPVPVVSDAAQAVCGSQSRCQGLASAVSFYPTKVLGCAGDGGMVLTDDDSIANGVRALANHGADGANGHVRIGGHVGGNSRLDAMQAALLQVHLEDLESRLNRRRLIAGQYMRRFGALAVPHDAGSPVSIFCLRHPDRDAFADRLKDRGIGTAIYYPRPLSDQPAVQQMAGFRQPEIPNARKFCAEALAIPCRATLSDEQVARIISAVEAAT